MRSKFLQTVKETFSPSEYIAPAFDGSGATTGDVSVPFILALELPLTVFASSCPWRRLL